MPLPDILSILFRGKVPGQLVVQFTDACNAACAQCAMRRSNRFDRHTLPLDAVKKNIDAAAEKGVQAISFTGGEPFLFFEDLMAMIDHAGKAGIPYIRTGTNGFSFRHKGDREKLVYRIEKIAEALAATPLRNLWISVDSAHGNLHENMRGLPGVIRGIETALPIFHRHGIFPSANLGINRYTGGKELDLSLKDGTRQAQEVLYNNFRSAFSRFYRFVTDLGFTIVNACYPMSLNDDTQAVYAANSAEWIVNFSKKEKALLFSALARTIPEFRSHIRIFSPLSSIVSLEAHYNGTPSFMAPCLGGIDFFFVDAKNGDTYPCGFRAQENFGKLWAFDSARVDRQKHCTRCDWECFRDPSELFFPVTSLFTAPGALVHKTIKPPPFFKHWLSDLLYYRACSYFNGRENMDTRRLKHFA